MASAVDDRVCGPFPKAPFQGSRGTGEHASGGSKALRGGDDASGTDSAVPGTDSPDPGAYEQPLQDLPR
jgi:hypothetical protein